MKQRAVHFIWSRNITRVLKNNSQKIRFAMVGVANTAIDLSVLFLLKTLGLPVVPANIISTSTAFCFSFFANKKYTFRTISSNVRREIILFVVVTLFGLWVLQTLVIYLVSSLLATTSLSDNLILIFAKIIAILVSLTWNYTMYSHVVFKQKGKT